MVKKAKMKRNVLLLILLFALMLTSCSGIVKPPAQTNQIKVLATETFLGNIAQNVAGERIKVETLLPATVDPHEFQPTPQDAIKIADSQVLIVNGLGYETWLSKTLADTGGKRLVIVASNGLTPKPDPSGEHPDGDPHMWMNPMTVIHSVENIRDGLSQTDPAGKETYAANADDYIAKLKDLDQWIKTNVAALPIEKRLLVTNHDALGYFSEAYGFKVVGAVIPSVTTEASPSAQQMAGQIDNIKSSGAPAISRDVGENQKLARQIASETGVKGVPDVDVESIPTADGPAPTYIDMIKHDVNSIVEALK